MSLTGLGGATVYVIHVGTMMNSAVIMQVCSKSRTVVFMRYIPNDMRKHLKVIVLFNAFTSINCL